MPERIHEQQTMLVPVDLLRRMSRELVLWSTAAGDSVDPDEYEDEYEAEIAETWELLLDRIRREAGEITS